MGRINFPALFGNIIQVNMTQLLNIIAEQEVEKDQLNTLLGQLKDGEVSMSQVEINPQTKEIRVVVSPPVTAVTLDEASQEELVTALGLKLQRQGEEDEVELAPVEEVPYQEFGSEDEEPPENINYSKPE